MALQHWMTSLACAAALTLGTSPASAQAAPWPTKPIRVTIPGAAGSAPDVMVRMLGEKLSAMWGQPIIVDNKPGGGGLIALNAANMGEKNDHGFLFATASLYTITPYMFKSPNVDLVRDFVPVAMVGVGPLMAAVSASSPAETLADVIAMAKKAPDSVVVATASTYTVPHLAVDIIDRAAGVQMRAVPYNSSGDGISAVINGDAQMVIDGIPPLDAMVKGKRLKAIAVFSDKRLPDRPQLATAAETYPSLVIHGWVGVMAPKGTRPEVIDRVNRDVATVLAMPDMVARFEALGIYPRAMTPQQFGAYWTEERLRWEKVLRDAGAQPTIQ